MSRSLERLAHGFAADMSELLNRTVTTGIRLPCRMSSPELAVAGLGAGKVTGAGFVRLATGRKAPAAYLGIGYTLGLDDDRFLTVARSKFKVCADGGGEQSLVRYDYDADPGNAYAPAHVQVAGESPALQVIRRRAPAVKDRLERLHFPVGDRRFRPALEDVVEFLVAERIASPHPGWEEVLARHRRSWRKVQVEVAVRRHPAWASAGLAGAGWTMRPPADVTPGQGDGDRS